MNEKNIPDAVMNNGHAKLPQKIEDTLWLAPSIIILVVSFLISLMAWEFDPAAILGQLTGTVLSPEYIILVLICIFGFKLRTWRQVVIHTCVCTSIRILIFFLVHAILRGQGEYVSDFLSRLPAYISIYALAFNILFIAVYLLRRGKNQGTKSLATVAEQRHALEQHNLGAMNEDSYDAKNSDSDVVLFDNLVMDAKAVQGVLKAAGQGNAQAQCALGMAYDNGWMGMDKNDAEAFKWYFKAAAQGVADAQNTIGFMYLHGRGVTENAPEAAKWFLKSAEQGNASAQCSLGVMYAEGEGVTQNAVEGLAWLYVARSNQPSENLGAVIELIEQLEKKLRTDRHTPSSGAGAGDCDGDSEQNLSGNMPTSAMRLLRSERNKIRHWSSK